MNIQVKLGHFELFAGYSHDKGEVGRAKLHSERRGGCPPKGENIQPLVWFGLVWFGLVWFGLVHGLIDWLLECPPGTHGVFKLREGTRQKNRGTNLKTPGAPGGLERPLGFPSPRRCLPIVQKKFSGQEPCQFDLI